MNTEDDKAIFGDLPLPELASDGEWKRAVSRRLLALEESAKHLDLSGYTDALEADVDSLVKSKAKLRASLVKIIETARLQIAKNELYDADLTLQLAVKELC